MQLLDFYQQKFGAAVKHQGNGWNGPCPLCGGEPGKSDRFMVWPDRSEGLGEICTKHGISGVWSCRQCGASGDTIAYLMQIEGLDFRGALAELGIEGGVPTYRRRKAPDAPKAEAASWTPREWPMPSDTWSAYAAKLVTEAEQEIWRQPTALKWLAARGIDAAAIRQYRIGYLRAESEKYHGRWRYRSALGLQPKVTDDGKVFQKIFIPRGIVVPTLEKNGSVLNLRIRRHKADLSQHSPKYLELEGSCRAPLLLRSSRPNHLAVYFIVEAELDAMLIHHASGGVVGALAVRTNRGKPDSIAHAILRDCVRICIALDYDSAGAEGVEFWEKTYSSSMRWPTPEGKDPGDAFGLGVDIREWIATALPASVRLPGQEHEEALEHEDGHLDATPSGELDLGEREESGNELFEKGIEPNKTPARADETASEATPAMQWASQSDFTGDELCRLRAALPDDMPLDYVPLDVARAYLLWRGIPATYRKFFTPEGTGAGFAWRIDYTWRKDHAERFEAFWAFLSASKTLHNWLDEHPAREIGYKNLLHFWR